MSMPVVSRRRAARAALAAALTAAAATSAAVAATDGEPGAGGDPAAPVACALQQPRSYDLGEAVRRGGYDVKIRCAAATKAVVLMYVVEPRIFRQSLGGGSVVHGDADVRFTGPGTKSVFVRFSRRARRELRGLRRVVGENAVGVVVRGSRDYHIRTARWPRFTMRR